MTVEEKQKLVRHVPLPEGMTRMESGPVAFGNDWPGYFLRGDNAFGTIQGMDYLEYILGQLERGEPVDTRPVTLMMAREGIARVKRLMACVLIDDKEAGQ